jgi:nucleoside-diphosphate-sugar epimerase
LRLDLTVNIFTNLAFNQSRITVFGGQQLRPNIHVDDMVDLYIQLLSAPAETVDGKVWNAGYDNMRVVDIASLVREEVGPQVELSITPTDDHRSYHISSERIRRELGYQPRRSVRDAVVDLIEAFRDGKAPNPLTDDRYYNIKRMQALKLT